MPRLPPRGIPDVPGLYLGAIAFSALGIALIDLRWRLVARGHGARWVIALAIGVAFFVVWDLVGIASGVFVQGASPAYVGIELAPHLPLEELCFLTFLSYLALVVHAGMMRMLEARTARRERS
jgi:lycopene cyclase domain-containing protein